jgi:hypothetical protein
MERRGCSRFWIESLVTGNASPPSLLSKHKQPRGGGTVATCEGRPERGVRPARAIPFDGQGKREKRE